MLWARGTAQGQRCAQNATSSEHGAKRDGQSTLRSSCSGCQRQRMPNIANRAAIRPGHMRRGFTRFKRHTRQIERTVQSPPLCLHRECRLRHSPTVVAGSSMDHRCTGTKKGKRLVYGVQQAQTAPEGRQGERTKRLPLPSPLGLRRGQGRLRSSRIASCRT